MTDTPKGKFNQNNLIYAFIIFAGVVFVGFLLLFFLDYKEIIDIQKIIKNPTTKTQENTLDVISPLEDQMIGGNNFSIRFDVSSKNSRNFLNEKNLDIYVNGEKDFGEDVDVSKKIHRVNVYRDYISINFITSKSGIQSGDKVKVSFERHNKLYDESKNVTMRKIKKDSYSWKYSDMVIPPVTSVVKSLKENPMRPEFNVALDVIDEDITKLEDMFSVYIGSCSKPEKKLKTSFEKIKDDEFVLRLKRDLKRVEEEQCLYLIDSVKIGNGKNEIIDRFSYVEPAASIDVSDLFNPEQEFASNLHIYFSTPMYTDIGENGSDKYIENRKKKKDFLLEKLHINSDVNVLSDSVFFSPEKAIIPIMLDENTMYEFTLDGFSDVYGEKFEKVEFKLQTQNQEYLGIKLDRNKTIYRDDDMPEFKFLQYGHPTTSVELCRISIKEYGMIEQLYKNRKEIAKTEEFFQKGIDGMEIRECLMKKISVGNDEYISKFGIDDLIGSPGRSGLYFMTFSESEDRKVTESALAQAPLFFSIVDSHISMKLSKNGKGFFWVNDFSEGEGIADLTLRAYKSHYEVNRYEKNGRIYNNPLDGVFEDGIVLGKTDENGYLEIDMPEELEAYMTSTDGGWWDGETMALVVTADSDEHLTYVSSTFDDGIANWNFGYEPTSAWGYGSSGSENDGQKYSSHLYTDRKLYLPGETVYIKSVLREHAKTLSIPEGVTFQMELKDPEYKVIFTEEFSVNEFGSFGKDYEIGEDAKLGNYRLSVSLPCDDEGINCWEFSTTFFSIEEFKKPNFKVDVHVSSDDLEDNFLKDPEVVSKKNEWGYEQKEITKSFSIDVNIHASYYNGGTVKNGTYRYNVYKQYYYESSYWNNCFWGCFYEPRKDYYSSGEGSLDNDGKGSLSLNIDHKTNYSNYSYIIEVTVKDENGETVTGSNSIIVKIPAEISSNNPYVSLQLGLENQFVKQGEDVIIELSPNKQWEDSFNDIKKLIISKKIYTTQHTKDINGRLVPHVDFEEEEVLKIDINNSNFEVLESGKLMYKFMPQDTGEYRIEIQDEKINNAPYYYRQETIKEKELFVYNSKEVMNTPVIDDNKIQVLAEKSTYKLGEKAKFLIRLPFEKAKLLITTEKTHVVDKKLIEIEGNNYLLEIDVDDTFVPNAYISVIAFEKGGEDYKVGYGEIIVDMSEKKLNIISKLNKEEYKPREIVSLTLETADIYGNAVPAELSVAVVDEALISMIGNIDMDILKTFYKKMAFQTDTSLTSVAMNNYIYFSRKGFVGGSGSKGAGSDIFTRSIFKNTAYYNGNVVTDKNGNATIDFELPDNIGEFRVIILGNSKESHFGGQEDNIAVRQDILIEENLPMIFRHGDKMKLGATIFNYQEKEVIADALFESDQLLIDNNSKTVTLPPNDRTFITWDVELRDVPEDVVTYTLEIVTEDNTGDRIQKEIDIASTPLIASHYHHQEDFVGSSKFSMNYTEEPNENLSYIEVMLSTSILAGVEKTFGSLARYPYGCIEQTTSSTIPNAVLLKMRDIFELEDVDYEEAEVNLKAGIARMFSMQKEDGGFGYWPGDTHSSHYSANATLGLVVMYKLLGEEIVNYSEDYIEHLDKAESYLIEHFKNKSSTSDRYDIAHLVQGFYALGLYESEYFDTAYDILQKHKENFNTNDKVTYALALGKYNLEKYKDEILEIIPTIDLVGIDTNRYYWNKRTTKALFAQLIILADPTSDKVEPLIKELYGYDLNSYYYSTQTKVQIFLAFIDYLENIEKISPQDTTIDLVVDGIKREVNLKGKQILAKEKIFFSDFEELSKNISFNFTSDTTQKIYTDASFYVYPEDPTTIKPESNGIMVERKIYEIEYDDEKERRWDPNIIGKEIENNTLTVGENYMVKIIIEADEDQRDIALESYLPGGIKVLHSKFKTDGSDADEEKNWVFRYNEYKKDVVFASAKHINEDREYEFTYFITPMIEGNFILPPVSVYPMYDPSVEGHTGYEELKIVK